MATQSNISRVVMSRVRVIHAARPFVSGTALASLLFLLALWGIGREVWVAHVVANAPSAGDVVAFVRFLALAFLNTRFIVQALTLLAGAAFVYAAVDMVRAFGMTQRYA